MDSAAAEVCDNGGMSRSRATRVVRASVAATVATFLALVSHVAGGGVMPEWLGIVVPWVLSLAICTILAGRTLSLLRLSVAVLASQALFHTLFVLGAPAAGGLPTGHVHGVGVLDLGGDVVASPDAAMWLSHAIAAVLTIAALYRGERAVRRLLSLAEQVLAEARRRLARVAGTIRLGLVAPPRALFVDAAAPLLLFLTTSVRRRGPPSAVVVSLPL